MRSFIKKHRKPLLASGTVALVAAVAVTGFIVSRPVPSPATGQAGVISRAAAADDWAALPRDADHNIIGEPEPTLDKKGEPIIPIGEAGEKRSADEPLPVVKVTEGTAVVDTTAGTASLLGLLLGYQNPDAILNRDDCLLDWAEAMLPTVNGATFSGVMSVCDRDAAVMYGGYSTSVRDLNLHAQNAPDKTVRTALSKVLFKNDQLGYASVSTEDGRGVLLVVAAATLDASKTKADNDLIGNGIAPLTGPEPVDPEKPTASPAP
jgi:hypothetical protein